MSKKEQSPDYYPVFLNISGKRCIVIGGGEVALRKVKTLLEHRARVEVISPELCPELTELSEGGQIRAFQRRYQSGDLRGAFLAIAATDDSEVNRQIAAEAQSASALVNVVDNAEYSNFISPATVRRGGLTIAISTAGLSPALARKIRTRLEQDFGTEYAALSQLIDEVRTEIRRRGLKVDSETWQEALELDLLASLVKQGHTEKAKEFLYQHLLKQTIKSGRVD